MGRFLEKFSYLPDPAVVVGNIENFRLFFLFDFLRDEPLREEVLCSMFDIILKSSSRSASTWRVFLRGGAVFGGGELWDDAENNYRFIKCYTQRVREYLSFISNLFADNSEICKENFLS